MIANLSKLCTILDYYRTSKKESAYFLLICFNFYKYFENSHFAQFRGKRKRDLIPVLLETGAYVRNGDWRQAQCWLRCQ